MTKKMLLASASFVACAMTQGLAAQAPAASAAPSAAPDSLTDEIIVTAQKRAESVNRVPIAISVLSPAKLIASGITSTQKIEIATPGLVFGNTNGFAQIYVRGIGTDLIVPGQEAPVAFYLDGVYLPFQASQLQELGDVERIEVLKGPQGTLYGRNTTGGAINIISREPTQDLMVQARGTIGTRGTRKGVAYVTGGLTDGIAVSVSGLISRRHGIVDNLTTGGRVDNERQEAIRGKIRFDAGGPLTATFSADYGHRSDSSGGGFTAIVRSNVPLPPGFGPSVTPRVTFTDANPFRRQTNWGLNGTIQYDLGPAVLKSITGYRHDNLRSQADGDSTSLPLLSFFSYFGNRSFTQELQLTSVDTGPLNYIVGGFFLDGKVFADPVNVFAGIPNTGAPNTVISGRSSIRSYAAYAQLSYELSDYLKLTGGLRYSYERRKLTAQTLLGIDVLPDATRVAFGLPLFDPRDTTDSVDPKVTVQYDRDGQLLYATFSKGFKSGSYNLYSVGDPGPLRPEKITAYEIGGKHRLTASGIQFNWAGFYYDYKDIQVAIKDPVVGGLGRTTNAASLRDKGVDVDLSVPLNRNLRFTVGAEYLDAKYNDFPNAAVFNIVNGVLDTVGTGDTTSADATGNRAVRAPKLTLTGSIDLRVPAEFGNVDFSITGYHNSGFYFDPGNRVRQPSFQLVNTSIRFSLPDNRVGISFFVNNLTKETVIQGINQTPYGVFGQYNDPRIFGTTISVQF